MQKCIVGKDINIEGHCVRAYYCKNMNGDIKLSPFCKSAAMVFPDNESAYVFRESQPGKENIYVEPFADAGYAMSMVM